MDLKSLDYDCPRCHATIGFDRDSCPACQSVLPATVPPCPTIQAHDGGVGSPPNASALANAANSRSPAHILVIRKLTAIRSSTDQSCLDLSNTRRT